MKIIKEKEKNQPFYLHKKISCGIFHYILLFKWHLALTRTNILQWHFILHLLHFAIKVKFRVKCDTFHNWINTFFFFFLVYFVLYDFSSVISSNVFFVVMPWFSGPGPVMQSTTCTFPLLTYLTCMLSMISCMSTMFCLPSRHTNPRT